jgi:hypothetical protein
VASIKGGERMKAKLAEIAKKLSRPASLKVGFMEGATYPDGQSVAEVAVYNEYGTETAPPRPFFRNAVDKYGDEWAPAIGKLLKRNDMDVVRTLQMTGEAIKGQVQQSIKDTNHPPLAESTIKRKGFEKPLIDTGQMLDSVEYQIDVK